MGCDIHLRVEHLAPAETLNERLEVVPEGPPEWTPAEKLTPLKESSVAPYGDEGYPDPYLEYEDRWYKGRDYMLFGVLAGVRSDGQIWDDRGMPDDASPHVMEDYEGWGLDAHTPSWQTLDELLAVDWHKVLTDPDYPQYKPNPTWLSLLERLKDLAFERCEGDQTRVRIVYWFDN